MGKHIAIYVRVSTDQQSTASQLPDLQKWAAAQDEPIRWYTEKKSAAGKASALRPVWRKVEDALYAGEISTLVCWRLDRIGRSAWQLLKLVEHMRDHSIRFVSMRDGVQDLTTPAGMMFLGMLANFAQFETEVRRERVLAGQAEARRAGKTWGGSEKGRRLHVTEEQVALIKRLKSEGQKISAISRSVSLSRPTVYKLLAEKD